LFERKMVVHLDQLTPYQGTIAVRTRPQGRKVRAITDVASTALRKEEMVKHL
jgi:hypothetical protein